MEYDEPTCGIDGLAPSGLVFSHLQRPPHWDPRRAYPLYVHLHGRGPDVPLPYVSDTFQPPKETEAKNAELIAIVPWLRGNGEWRNENRIRARHMGSDRGYKGLRYGGSEPLVSLRAFMGRRRHVVNCPTYARFRGSRLLIKDELLLRIAIGRLPFDKNDELGTAFGEE